MPKGDKTGPVGQGPMTGRATGFCAGHHSPGYMNPGGKFSGRRFFRGRGRGMMHGHWFYTAGHPGRISNDMCFPTWDMEYIPCPEEIEPAEESKMLSQQADYLKQQLDDIQKRLSELENQKKSK
jgi:hypothetical protein